MPAPTSIGAFVGYSHPFKTQTFGAAQRIFSFTDYETYFGGLFSSGLIDASLPRAVYQFFLNGGSDAYVVGLQPGLFNAAGGIVKRLGPGGDTITGALTTTGGSIVFTAMELTDAVPMTVTLTNVRNSAADFDVVVTYGTKVETFRGISLDAGQRSVARCGDQQGLDPDQRGAGGRATARRSRFRSTRSRSPIPSAPRSRPDSAAPTSSRCSRPTARSTMSKYSTCC